MKFLFLKKKHFNSIFNLLTSLIYLFLSNFFLFFFFATLVSPGPVETPMLELQVNYEEAKRTFSLPTSTPDQIVDKILNEVIPSRTLCSSFPPAFANCARFGEISIGTPIYSLLMLIATFLSTKGLNEYLQKHSSRNNISSKNSPSLSNSSSASGINSPSLSNSTSSKKQN